MSLTSDQIVERRRMQRRLSAWRALTFLAIAVAVVVGAWRLTASHGGPVGLVPHLARLQISGLITGDRDTINLIDEIGKSRAAGVLVEIDSPGGTTAGSERLYDALRRLSAKKPTVAVVRGLAASGGYIAAIGTDHIVAEETSLVGSIGVIFQFPNVSGALDKLGIKVESIKSTPLKAAPSGYEPTSPEAKAAIDALVVDGYSWFKGLVKARRHLDDSGLAAVDDGRVFTGRQSVGLHLIDGLGEERDAVAWLETSRGVAKGLSILDWHKTSGLGQFGFFSLARTLGLGALADVLDRMGREAETRSLDGMLAIWPGAPGT